MVDCIIVRDSGLYKRCSRCRQEFPATREHFYACSRKGLANYCKTCAKAAARERWERVKDEKREYNAEKTRKWRAENLDYARKREAYYNETHREEIRERQRKRYVEDKSRFKTYRAKREALKAGLPTTLTAEQWQRALDYFNGCCAACGRPPGFWHTIAADHWFPLSKGGSTTALNIVPLCHSTGGCNNSKRDKNAEEWLIDRFGKRKGRAILKRILDYFEWVKQQDE